MSLTISLAASAFAVGLLGGVHCVGMCGGIVAGLSAGQAKSHSMHLAFNLGRLLSYSVAGAIAGSVGALGLLFGRIAPIQLALYVLANALLIGLGLYLAGWSGMVTWLERPGRLAWRRVQPVIKRVVPARNWRSAIGLGALWGWVPCGLVYSVLASAMLSGSAVNGAFIMLVFGLGTLPNLIITGYFMRDIRSKFQLPMVRWFAGIVVAGLGVVGLSRAAGLSAQPIASLFCIG